MGGHVRRMRCSPLWLTTHHHLASSSLGPVSLPALFPPSRGRLHRGLPQAARCPGCSETSVTDKPPGQRAHHGRSWSCTSRRMGWCERTGDGQAGFPGSRSGAQARRGDEGDEGDEGVCQAAMPTFGSVRIRTGQLFHLIAPVEGSQGRSSSSPARCLNAVLRRQSRVVCRRAHAHVLRSLGDVELHLGGVSVWALRRENHRRRIQNPSYRRGGVADCCRRSILAGPCRQPSHQSPAPAQASSL